VRGYKACAVRATQAIEMAIEWTTAFKRDFRQLITGKDGQPFHDGPYEQRMAYPMTL